MSIKSWFESLFKSKIELNPRNDGVECGDKIAMKWFRTDMGMYPQCDWVIAVNKKSKKVIVGTQMDNDTLDSRDVYGWNGEYWRYEEGRFNNIRKAQRKFNETTKSKDWKVCSK